MTGPEQHDAHDTHVDRVEPDRRLGGYAVEAAIGLAIALLLLWVAIASTTDVPFVYQGL